MNDAPIDLWYVFWMSSVTISLNMASILVLRSNWIEKRRKTNILVANISSKIYYIMILVVIYILVTRPNLGFATDYDAWRRRTIATYAMLSLIVAVGISTVWSTIKSRCPKCGQRSLHAIYPPVGKYSRLCSKCDYSVFSRNYISENQRKAERRESSSITSAESRDASSQSVKMPSGRQDGAVDAVQALDESGHTGPA